MIQIMVFDFWKRLYKIMKCQYATEERGKGLVGKATRDTVQRSIGCGKEVVLTENMIKKCICIELPATSRFLDSRTSSRGSKNHRPSLVLMVLGRS